MSSPIKSVTVSANGSGQFTAKVEFARPLSETDTRSEFNLGRHWERIRSRARTEMVNAIAEREQRTNEPLDQARARVRKSLGRLTVAAQNIDKQNRWHGISFQESASAAVSRTPLVTSHR